MWTFYAPSVDPTMGTSLPADPVDGQEFTLVDSMSAPTYSWKLRYVAAKSSNKWVFVGGTPLQAEVATSENTSSTTYAALATAGPSVTVPVAGDYYVAHGAKHLAPAAALHSTMSYDIGATGAVDADGVNALLAVSSAGGISTARVKKQAGLTAVTLTAKYKVSGSNANFAERWISLTPIAIGG